MVVKNGEERDPAVDAPWWHNRQPPPKVVQDPYGVRRLLGRRWALIIGNEFHCPVGHRIRSASLVIDSHVWRCTHRPAHASGDCGLMFYGVAHLSPIADRESGATDARLIWAIELDITELRWMQKEGIRRIQDVQRYLGGFWSRSPAGPA